jgi:hypothetical protein
LVKPITTTAKNTRLFYLNFSLCFSASTVTVSATANLLRLSPSVLPSSFSRINPETSVDQQDPDPGTKEGEEKEEKEEEVIEMDVGKGEEMEEEKEKKEMEVEVLEESFEEELDEELDEEELEAELEEAMKGLRREQGNKNPFKKSMTYLASFFGFRTQRTKS